MTKYILFSIIFFTQALPAAELKCFFEEVYSNGQTQQGYLLIKNDKMRYQYNDQNLYTIIHNQNNFYVVENRDLTKFTLLDQKTETLSEIIKIVNDYPNFKNFYEANDIQINLEKTKDKNFIKRLAIISANTNMSIYLYSCQNILIKDMYFSFSPIFQFNEN